MSNIQEVFGQFAVEIDGKPHLYPTRQEAASALVLHEQTASLETRIAAYCENAGVEGKVAASRGNIIRAFLVFEASQAAEGITAAEPSLSVVGSEESEAAF